MTPPAPLSPRREGGARRRYSLSALATVCAMGALLLAGCTSDPRPTDLSVELMQLRGDISVDRVQLRLGNDGTDDIDVVSARLESPLFAGSIEWLKAPARLGSGAIVDLPFLLPDLACVPDAEGQPLSAVLEVRLPGGSPQTIEVEPGDQLGALDRLERAACLEQRVEETVVMRGVLVEVSGAGSDAVARLTVSLDPTGHGQPVQLREIRSTVLLMPLSGQQWPLETTIDADSGPSQVVLEIVPRRCDGHALGEDKVGTLFPVVVETPAEAGAEAEPGIFTLTLADGVKNSLLDFVSLRCGLGAR